MGNLCIQNESELEQRFKEANAKNDINIFFDAVGPFYFEARKAIDENDFEVMKKCRPNLVVAYDKSNEVKHEYWCEIIEQAIKMIDDKVK